MTDATESATGLTADDLVVSNCHLCGLECYAPDPGNAALARRVYPSRHLRPDPRQAWVRVTRDHQAPVCRRCANGQGAYWPPGGGPGR